MATYTGKSGVIKISDDVTSAPGTLQAVLEVKSFTLDSTMDTIENTVMVNGGDNARTYKAGLETSTFTAEILYAAQEIGGVSTDIPALLLGQEGGMFELYPSGPASSLSNTKISGSCLVTGYSVSSSFDDMVTATISAQVTGVLTYATIS